MNLNKFSIKYSIVLKRLMDVLLSLMALVTLSPVLIVTALLIKLEDFGPIFYVQDRVGRNEEIFKILKFRSMKNIIRVIHHQTFSGSSGVTKIGGFIRRFKIDELPQLINVVKGDMSIIGPRPCLPETVQCFGGKSKIRHSIRPGLSGISQISGNIYLTWEERLKCDLDYVNNISILLDLKIILKTIYLLFAGEEKGKKI